MPSPAPTAEQDPRFPSGPWGGFFQQRADRPTAQDMHFVGGRLTGAGADDCGAFTLSGRYDAARGTADWTKFYGTHAVTYRGFAEDDSLWGTWQLTSGRDRGGFRLWPAKRGRGRATAGARAARPAVIGGEAETADVFADSFARELEPAGAAGS